MRWLLRNYSWISKALGILVLLAGGYSGIWAAWMNYPLGVVAFLGVGATAMAFAAIYFMAQIADIIEQHTGDVALGLAMSEALERRMSVGDRSCTCGAAAALWADTAPGTDWDANLKFRWIKQTVINGHITSAGPFNEHGDTDAETVVQMSDLAAFFRRKGWKNLVIVPPGQYEKK